MAIFSGHTVCDGGAKRRMFFVFVGGNNDETSIRYPAIRVMSASLRPLPASSERATKKQYWISNKCSSSHVAFLLWWTLNWYLDNMLLGNAPSGIGDWRIPDKDRGFRSNLLSRYRYRLADSWPLLMWYWKLLRKCPVGLKIK